MYLKKIILLLVLFILISCKKDRDCECTIITESSLGIVIQQPPQTTTFKKINKREAKIICAKTTTTNLITGNSTTNNCKLK